MPEEIQWSKEVAEALLAPFSDGEVKIREGKFRYIEARSVMDRLDEVVGSGNWHFRCDPVPHQQEGVGAVIKGSLTVLGVTREDLGEHWRTSHPKDNVEVYKSAVSDALKRSAVHFGIGRYLYSEPDAAPAAQPARGDTAPPKPTVGQGLTEAQKCSNEGCGRSLTTGGYETSMRIYKKPLCYNCGQEESKARAAARAAREAGQ